MATQATREALAADLGRSQLALQEAYREAERLNAEVSRLAGLSAMHRDQRDDLLAALEGMVEKAHYDRETDAVVEVPFIAFDMARAAIARAKGTQS